ncbi:MAG: ABC transporter permease [Opitutaceae bacterium]|nr:ABC transporter permease [Opitutaceae bacterium]
MLSDIRFALRQFAKSPGFTFVAIATLALGIGVCTAMFSIARAVLLKPLPIREPERLVWIENGSGGGLSGRTARADVFNSWREHNKSFEALAAYFAFSDYGRLTLSGSGEPERLRSVAVSDNFLPVLGVGLAHGRNFTAEECRWRGQDGLTIKPGAVILSHSFWQRRFAGDPTVIGRVFILNNSPTAVVGVLPDTFDFDAIFSPGNEVDVIQPFPLTPESARLGNTIFGIGRLKPGVTLEQAQAELTVINEQLRTGPSSIPNGWTFGAVVSPLDTALRGRFRGPFLLLAGAVACVLVIACVNLSNLLLARVNVRRQEFAVRIALGATRGHLIRQALTESLVLAFGGSGIGVLLAVWTTHVLAQLQTFGMPLLQDASVDPLALAVTVGLTMLVGIACGLLPALQLSRQSSPTLQNTTHQRSAGHSAAHIRNLLVVTEVALACMLLVGASLLFRSFHAVLQVNLGFQPQHAMAWRVDSPRAFAGPAEANVYFDSLVARVAALPGVESVGLSDCLPLGRNRSWGAGAIGVTYPKGKYPGAYPRFVDHRYLRTMKIALISGRTFEERDDEKAPRAVVINESLARAAFPDKRDPLGQKIRLGKDGATIIGVVADVRHSSLEQGGGPEMYLCFRQGNDTLGLEMVVRSNRPPGSLIPEVRAALASHDPSLPTGDYYELDRLVDNAVGPRRLVTRLLSFFSGLALLLAAIGLYGVMAFAVTQRRQEIGIRMAIGAQRGDILQMIMQSGLKLVAVGISAGLLGSLALTRALQNQLFGVTAYDPLTFISIAAILTLIASVACLLPALRAMRVDPLTALRTE